MNKWHRVISALLAVVLVVGLLPAIGITLPAAALRVDADRDYTIGETVDYSAVFEDALIVVPGSDGTGTVNYLYRGRAVSEPYTQGRHFAYVSDAIEAAGGNAAVFYLASGDYSGSYSFPAGSVVLGANAGICPNGQISFDLPDVTKGWAAADRFEETVLTDGIRSDGNIIIDGISYNGTGALFASADADPTTRAEFKVTVQNSLISGISEQSLFFDTSASYSDGYAFDIKDTRITDTASKNPFCKNTYAIHIDGVYFYNNSGRLISCDGGFAEYNFSLDVYRSYFYKNSTGNYNINVSYTSGDHVSHLVFDKFLWYEGNCTDFGFVRFYTTPDTRFSSYKVDVINSTFLADKSYNATRNLTVINGNQSLYQLGTYTINFNNNRVIGFASMFPNVSGQPGTHKIHADFNNNYFAPSFTSVTDALGKRSEYNNYTDAHGTNAFNNIDYARLDLLNYYTDYAMTLSDKTFYVNGISFYDNVDYVSIDNKNSKVTVGMRAGSVQNPAVYFENSAVSAKIYTDSSCTKECTSFSAPARGNISTYYVQATCGSTQKKITLYVYGEEAVPYFKDAYVDSTGVIKNTAYLLCDAGESGNIEVEFDGSPYLFTVGQNAFSTVEKILAASSGVPQIILPYGDYNGIEFCGECEVYGQNRRTAVASCFDTDVVTGTDWVSGKSARLSDAYVSSGSVTFSGVEFADTLDIENNADVSIINSKVASVDHAGGTGALSLEGCAVTSDTLMYGSLPAAVTLDGCYFKNGASAGSTRWSTASYDVGCKFIVNGCLFDGVSGTVVSDARQGTAEAGADVVLEITDNVFYVDCADTPALSIKPSAYGSVNITGNRFVANTDSGAPIYFDNTADCETLTMLKNRFIGFARIETATDKYPVNGSNNYFAKYTKDYKSAADGTAIPGAVYCSDYYKDYAMTAAVPSVSGYSFTDAVTVNGRRLYITAAGNVTDISAYILAECEVEVLDSNKNKCDITALASGYDTVYYTLAFYNKVSPFSRVEYQLWLVRDIPAGCGVLSVSSDVAHVERDGFGVFNMTLPASLSQADISVLTDGGIAELYKDGDLQQGIYDIPEGRTVDYELRVTNGGNTVRYRLSVHRPMSSGIAIDYDEVVKTAYIIGADRYGDSVSLYYRGRTVTLAYNAQRHFDSFDKAYDAYLATDPDIINDTPVFVFAAGDYGSINVKYRAVILGANAGIKPMADTAPGSLPYDLPSANPARSETETTRFFGGIIRPAADAELENVENSTDSRLELYTVADGIDIVSDNAFINEDGQRRHKIYIQNTVSSSPLATGGGRGDITLKNVYVSAPQGAVTSIATDTLTVDDSYISGVAAESLFDNVAGSVSVKNSFITGGSRLCASVTGNVAVTSSILSSVDIEVTGADAFEMSESTLVGGDLAVGTGIEAVVANNRFIGCDNVTADSIGINYHAKSFTDENDSVGIPFGNDWYIDYKMTLRRSDFNVMGIEFESGVHEYTVDNGIPFIDIVLTSKDAVGVRFITGGSNVTSTLECDGMTADNISADNVYTLTLKKGDYDHTVRVSVGFADVGSFADSDGIGIIKNTAVMIAPGIIADEGEGRVIEWQGKKFKYVYGQNLFASMDEARKKLDGHLQMMLPAYDFEDAIIMPVDTSVYGVNFDVDPNIKSDVLGDDWARNPEWGRYGHTEIKNISVPYEATGTLIELYGITLRGRIYDGERISSPLCTEFNIVNTLVEHEDWMETIYGGTSHLYTITLTNGNSTAGSANNDRGCIRNMRVEKLRVNPEVSANRNRLLNERLPGDFTVDGLYLDMKKADCSLIGWMKMSDYQKNGKVTWKNCNLRNAIDVNASLNLAFEGRDHAAVGNNDSIVATIENCTFYNVQNSRKSALQFALQAYSELNIRNNLFLQSSSTSVQVFTFNGESTLANTKLNITGNRFVGTKGTISLTTGTGSFSLADNYYAAYSADYKNGTAGKALSGTKATCSSYYVDYALNFKNTDIAPYAFGNGMEWDVKNKTLSLTRDARDGTLFSLYDYVVSNPSGHTITVAEASSPAAIPLSDGENKFTVTVGGKDVYTLTVYLKSVSALLEEKIAIAAEIVNSDEFSQYTQQSASALRLAYNDARRALNGTSTGASQLLSALETLTDALANITVDTAALLARVAACPDNADGRYTAESYAVLSDVIGRINKTTSFSPAMKLAFENELDLALAGLVDRSEYDKALKKALGENVGVYSYDVAKAFLDRVNEIADSAVIVTPSDVVRETERIRAAYSLLVKDTVRLESALGSVRALRKWDWTHISYVSVLDAAAVAEEITQANSQSEIDSAISNIESALSALVQTKVFGDAMRRAEALTNDGRYSQASWSAFTNELDTVTAQAMQYTTTQQSLDGANRISLAIASLTTDTSALESALTRAQNHSRNGYTTASVAALDAAISAARNVGGNSTQAQIDACVSALNNAVSSLVAYAPLNNALAAVEAINNSAGGYCASSYTAFRAKLTSLRSRINTVANAAQSQAFLKEIEDSKKLLTKHNYVYKNNNDATCKKAGTKTGTCSCGAKTTVQVTGSLAPHKCNTYTYNNDATYASDGTKSGKCIWCGTRVTVKAEGTRLTVKPIDSAKKFRDIKVGAWYKNAVDYAVGAGFISGMSETEFGVSTPVTRGMFITILARIAGVDTSKSANSTTTKFTDVGYGKYYTAAIKWAVANGVANGMSDTQFAPDNAIQRQQLCVMIVNFARFCKVSIGKAEPAIAFADAGSIANYAKSAVSVCQMADIVNGYPEGSVTVFKPQNTATRAEAAQILYKFHSTYVAK